GEIRRREWRGRTEIVDVHALDGSPNPFGDYRVTSSSGSSYTVEIRSLGTHINSCGCRDHRTNRLGTCKHIEGVLHRLRGNRAAPPRRRTPKGQESSGRIEIFLDERDDRAVRMTVPEAIESADPAFVQEAARHWRSLRRTSRKAFDSLREMAHAHPERLRLSRSLETWLDARKAPVRRQRERARFEVALQAGRRSFDFLKQPLLPYQVEGALHLAFGERVLLADDMGLGKTVQAIAACAMLRELRGVERVLVVSPASLKAEWEEQIAKFSDLPSTIVFGGRPARCAAYRRHTFFTLCNYEQVVADGKDLVDALRPDVVILDEAQRIKNWQTKTANAVKKLQSRYAFVLTGTPLENRIDEIYSIVQFLDPDLLGPLFRFNREFYELDAKGRPSGFRNLEELARRVSSVMLRRRKEDVENELPGRTTKTFFVPMTETQTRTYEDYDLYVKRLAALAAKRPLTKDEFDRLQKFLACMRMICDTPYILGDENRDCPKMEEIERLLPDLLDDPERKIIVFSEWVRMLELVRECAVTAGVEFAWHTGSVPQTRRRAEIHRFREDPHCR
ncbi:MAG: SNF2-related protein, partial [Thiotrichales bacterium]|nr:SNF2-related protein [Thiotrichales bacterium]